MKTVGRREYSAPFSFLLAPALPWTPPSSPPFYKTPFVYRKAFLSNFLLQINREKSRKRLNRHERRACKGERDLGISSGGARCFSEEWCVVHETGVLVKRESVFGCVFVFESRVNVKLGYIKGGGV